MEQQYAEFVGVDNLHYALVTTDNESSYVAGAPVYLAPVAEIAGSPEVSNKTTYYDNKAGNNYVTEGKTELKIVVSGIAAEMAATLLGKKYDAASGRVYDSGQANPPAVALGFRFNKGSGYRYYWYLNGTFSGGSEDAQSKSNDVNEKTYELTFTAVTTAHEFTVDAESMSLKRVFGDTSDATFDETGWFDQVQTPSSVGAPSAVALSSIVPADNATNITVTDNIVLTFNNAIESEAVSVIKADGTIVAGAKTWDATYKILTFNPTASLDAGATYIVAVNGVVDIYGQALTAVAKNFETAA